LALRVIDQPYLIERLESHHDRAAFRCGVEPLDRYLTSQATQDIRRRVAGCFVAVEAGAPQVIAGYFTLAAMGIPLADVNAATAKKLPRYPVVPGVLMGRLAVSEQHRGKGLGAALLIDGVKRTLQADLMVFAMVVDAKDDAAVAFYQHHGFIPFVSVPMRLYLPLAEIAKQLGVATPK
jgi:GNAT superfamily N-acetyltransferase